MQVQKKHKTGIRRKVMAFICLSIIIIMIIGMGSVYFFGFRQLRETTGREYLQMSRLLGTYVSGELEGEVEDAQTYATRPLWLDMVKEANLKYAGRDREAIERHLLDMDKKWAAAGKGDTLLKEYLQNRVSLSMQDIRKIRKNVAEIFITDKFGGLVAASNKTSDFYQADEEWWQKAFSGGKGKVYVGSIEFDQSTQTWIAPLAVPIIGPDNDVIGVCKVGISIARLFARLEDFKIGRTGHAALVDKKGYIIFHHDIVPMSVQLYTEDGFRKLLNDKEGYTIADGLGTHKPEMFIAFAKIASPFLADNGIEWLIFIDQEASEAFASLNRFIFHLAVITAVLLLIMFPIGYFFGGIFAKPIKQLHEATEKVMEGNWDYPIEANTGDEIEQFADTFREMISNLKNKQNQLLNAKKELEDLSRDLERKVEDRTKDLTEAKNSLDRYSKELEQALKIKSDFTSTVSHELRTPLSAMKESIAIVLDGTAGAINNEQKEFLVIAKRNVDRLARLINDILDFQKLESGKMTFDIQENNINEVVKEVRSAMLALAESKNLAFTLKLEDNLPCARFDKDKIIQVLTNLIDNAIKFTEAGGITVVARQKGNFIEVAVQDTGAGMKAEDIPRLFRQFEQLEKGVSRKTGGTGLGLAISKEIVEKHKGRIWAESELGKGTVFSFILPIS